MQIITFTRNASTIAACAKALARGERTPRGSPYVTTASMRRFGQPIADTTSLRSRKSCFAAILLNRAAIGGAYKV
jgi:hypothetical protein